MEITVIASSQRDLSGESTGWLTPDGRSWGRLSAAAILREFPIQFLLLLNGTVKLSPSFWSAYYNVFIPISTVYFPQCFVDSFGPGTPTRLVVVGVSLLPVSGIWDSRSTHSMEIFVLSFVLVLGLDFLFLVIFSFDIHLSHTCHFFEHL